MVGVECIRRALGSAGVFLGGVGGGDVVVADNSVAGCLMVVGSFAIGDIVLAVVMGVGEAVGYVLVTGVMSRLSESGVVTALEVEVVGFGDAARATTLS